MKSVISRLKYLLEETNKLNYTDDRAMNNSCKLAYLTAGVKNVIDFVENWETEKDNEKFKEEK